MAAGGKASFVGEVEILRDQEAFFPLHSFPDLVVDTSAQLLFDDCVDIMSECSEPDRG